MKLFRVRKECENVFTALISYTPGRVYFAHPNRKAYWVFTWKLGSSAPWWRKQTFYGRGRK